MRKKTKVISAVLALCLSVSMLAVGVLAASTVTLNVTSSVTFKSTGAYVMATGQVKRGTEGSLTNLTEENRPDTDITTGASYSYTGYSYTPIGSGSDANAPDGTAPKDLEDWTIGEIEFLDKAPVIQYSISFKNYGESDVEINITGMPDEITNVEIQGTTLPITVASGETEEYTLTLTLTKFNESIDPAVQVNLNTSMVSKSVSTAPDETYTVNYNIGGNGGEGTYMSFYVDGVEMLYIDWFQSSMFNTSGSFEVVAGSILEVGGERNATTQNISNFYIPYDFFPAPGSYGYICEIYDSNNIKVAEAKTGFVNAKQEITSSSGFPYTINSDIRIEIFGWEP